MAEEITDNTPGATDNNQSGEETKNQDDVLSKLTEYEQKLSRLTEVEKELNKAEEEKKAALAEAARWNASYKGLQRQTTQTLQEAAENRRKLTETERSQQELLAYLGEIRDVKETLSVLARSVLDEDRAKEFDISSREQRLKREEELQKQRTAYAQQLQAQPQAQQQQYTYTDPEEERRAFLDFYFPGSGIDPNDSNLDWGYDATSQPDAFRRFTTSVQNIQRSLQAKPAPVASKTETEETLEELRKRIAELDTAKQTLAEEVKAQARKDVEDRLRKLGVDAEPPTTRGASSPRVQTKLDEIDESKLMSGYDVSSRKRAAQEYQAQLDEVRKQLIGNYR